MEKDVPYQCKIFILTLNETYDRVIKYDYSEE